MTPVACTGDSDLVGGCSIYALLRTHCTDCRNAFQSYAFRGPCLQTLGDRKRWHRYCWHFGGYRTAAPASERTPRYTAAHSIWASGAVHNQLSHKLTTQKYWLWHPLAFYLCKSLYWQNFELNVYKFTYCVLFPPRNVSSIQNVCTGMPVYHPLQTNYHFVTIVTIAIKICVCIYVCNIKHVCRITQKQI